MNIVEIIDKKSENKSLSKEEIDFFIKGFTEGTIPDYQISSLLMAIKINGMNDNEIFAYTESMIESGDTYNIKGDDLFDKHSTGGVGDKVSIALLPILGSMGLRTLKMSGRGLGFTGGTIDKLESIPGFKVKLSKKEAFDIVNNKSGLALTDSSNSIVPADKKIYALRDVTGTVDSIPLIAGSIMSKKIASGTKYIFIDLKVGLGAFMPTIEQATKLGNVMQKIGKHFRREVFIGMTSMNQPLGKFIGNSLEIAEAIEIIKGNGVEDAHELIVKIASEIHSKIYNIKIEKSIELVKKVMIDGSALKMFSKWIIEQGGDIDYIMSKSFPESRISKKIKSPKSGFVTFSNVKDFGYSAIDIGAGRKLKTDKLDYHAGIEIHKKHGEYVEKNETLITVYSKSEVTEEFQKKILSNFNIVFKKPKLNKIILKEIRW